MALHLRTVNEMKCRFVVSVDTEEDIWGWRSRNQITCMNVFELPRLARFFQRLHIRPTFFASYRVLSDSCGRQVMAELATEDSFEVGIHVHPWNTPPDDGSLRRTGLHNLTAEVQAAKIATVTRVYEELLHRRPNSFRAGRFAFGPETAGCLIEQGYTVDSSVTPFFDWTNSSRGQNYVGAPLEIYRLSPECGVLKSDPRGRLVEVPLTSGYTALRPDQWQAVGSFLDQASVRALHIAGAAARGLGFRKAILSPESHTVGDMVRLSKTVVRSGVRHLQLFFHSSSLMPGLTPFTRTPGDVERLLDRIEELLERLHRWHELEFASVSEAAEEALYEPAGAAIREPPLVSVASVERGYLSPPQQGKHGALRWAGLRGTRVRLAHLARSVYWRVGGYRQFQRVRWSSVKRLVFVCSGNICRSPYAEYVALAGGLEATSVGINTGLLGVADPMALRVARDRGIRMDAHRTRPLEELQPREGDLFIAMEPFQAAIVAERFGVGAHQVTLLGLWAGSNGPVIPDPYGGDEQRFNDCFSVIDRGVTRIERRLEVEPSSSGQRRATPSSHAAS